MTTFYCRRTKELGCKASSSDAAWNSLTRLLATRGRSVQESRERLLEKGYDDKVVEFVLNRALACGLLDDQKFAQSLIKGRIAAGWGIRRIERELSRFGINTENIDGYPEAFISEDALLVKACALLRRHRSTSKNPRQAAYRYLMSRGYNQDIALAAIQKTQEDSTSTD